MLSAMCPRLYDFKSFVMNALRSIGILLLAKIVAEVNPAMT